MFKNSIFKKQPIFIPKLCQNEAGFVANKKLPSILMGAHIVQNFPKPVLKIKNSAEIFIIDPSTNYFTEQQYTKESCLSKLSTSPEKPYKIEDLLTNEKLRKYEMVEKNIDFQIENNANLVIVPYIYMDSTDDSRFGINLSMVSDSIKLKKDKKINLPLYAMINIGSSILNDTSKLDYLIKRYDEDFGNEIEGYFIMIDKLNCKNSDKDLLLGLAYLIFNLSENKDVFILSIDDFGEILCSIGASGYSSGLGGGETFNSEKLIKKLFGRTRKHKEITYVPDFFNYINDEALKKIGYKCDCCACNKKIPNTFNETRQHFLNIKISAAEKLEALDQENKLKYMISRVEEANSSINKFKSELMLLINANFLIIWKEILEEVVNWDHKINKKEEVDIDKIIEEVNKNE